MRKTPFVLLSVFCLALFMMSSYGDEDEKGRGKSQLQGIANALSKGDMKTADALAKKASKGKEVIEHFMEIMEKRRKDGMAPNVTFSKRKPESIEKLVLLLAAKKLTAEDLKKNAKSLEQMGLHIAAIAKICEAKPPRKDKEKKTKARWLTYAESMRDGSLDLVKAVKASSVDDVHAAAVRIKGTCTSCHKTFRGKE